MSIASFACFLAYAIADSSGMPGAFASWVANALSMKIVRCNWVDGSSEMMTKYHDEEWGGPLRNEHRLLEAIVLDGAQAGLSWSTILNRREGYRKAFRGFDPEIVARFNERTIQKLLRDPGIIRNEAKVRSAVQNAKATLALHKAGTTLKELPWSFVNN